MSDVIHSLGTVEASEALITDLYIELWRRVNQWAAVTHQTAQARMGYIGQHLVSVATGYPGRRSGARGKDLILSDSEHAEIKALLRQAEARGREALIEALGAAISAVSPADARGFFEHGGYRLPVHVL